MGARSAVLLASLIASSAACAAPGERQSAQPRTAGAPAASAKGAAIANGVEKFGVVAPSEFDAISIWPEQHAGSLLVLEVLPHGSTVARGDSIATLDTRSIDEELHRVELETKSTEIRHAGVIAKNDLEEESARSQLVLAKAGLERAQRSLEGWKKFELAFAKRQDEIAKRYEQANVDDQVDELDQLEKMYKADALVDATEDIVVKRSRRQLDTTKVQNQLARDRSQYKEQFELALQTEQKEEQVRTQNEALARLIRQQEIDARAREDAEARSADGLREQQEKLARLRRDRERLTLRAPRDGVLLHGAAKDYRPGRAPARVERGGQLAMRQDLFLIAAPNPDAIALEIGDADFAKLRDGARVRIETLGASKLAQGGTVHIDGYPRSTNPTDSTYDARVLLEAPLAGALYGTRAKVVVEGVDG